VIIKANYFYDDFTLIRLLVGDMPDAQVAVAACINFPGLLGCGTGRQAGHDIPR
jgi:hypothetical protein